MDALQTSVHVVCLQATCRGMQNEQRLDHLELTLSQDHSIVLILVISKRGLSMHAHRLNIMQFERGVGRGKFLKTELYNYIGEYKLSDLA